MIDYDKLQEDCIAWKENVEFAEGRLKAEQRVLNSHIESQRQSLNRLSSPLTEVIAQFRDYPFDLVKEKLLLPPNVWLMTANQIRQGPPNADISIVLGKKLFFFRLPFDAELFIMRINRFVTEFPKDDVAEQQRKVKIASSKREIIKHQKLLKDLEGDKIDFT